MAEEKEDGLDVSSDSDTNSEFESSDSDEGDSKTGLTQNQNRLLYLVSLYSKKVVRPNCGKAVVVHLVATALLDA